MLESLSGLIRATECRVLVVGDVMLDRYWHGEVARWLELQQAMAWANKAGALVVAKSGTASLIYDELLA
jgi:bifunctional ADP-heptose synthase (sugar kinase/adenylyltransferase)